VGLVGLTAYLAPLAGLIMAGFFAYAFWLDRAEG
jgi:hypothetical protein